MSKKTIVKIESYDPATISFVSASKNYYDVLSLEGSESKFVKKLKKLKKIEELNKIDLLYTKTLKLKKLKWKHMNIYGFPYYCTGFNVVIDLYYVKEGNVYKRLFLPKFSKITYHDDFFKKESDVTYGWGNKDIVIYKKDNIYSNLAFEEKIFKTKKELQNDYKKQNNKVNMKVFSDEIFADG